jgi:uncharacterized protein YprB with RNaseH-like and TPR domain
MKVGYLDIETTNFQANFGFMLSWAMYIPDKPLTYITAPGITPVTYELEDIVTANPGTTKWDVIKRREAINWKKQDYRICKSLMKALREVDLVVTYYGTKFDVPYMRSRALYHRLDFPKYQEVLHLDMYYRVKALLKLGRNTLDQATEFFGIEGKTHVKPTLWNRARVGDKEALEYVLDHNIEDVKILAVLHSHLAGFRNITRRSL